MVKEVGYEVVKIIAKEDIKRLALFEISPIDEYKAGKPRRLSPKNCFKKSF